MERFKRIDASTNHMSGFQEWYEVGKHLLRTTQIEIFLVAALGAAVAGYGSLKNEIARSHVIPLGFSEMTQIEKDAKRENVTLGSMNLYLPALNDATMKIFESHNLAWKSGGEFENAFADQLQEHFNPVEQQYHHTLKYILEDLPQKSSAVVKDLKDFRDVRDKMAPVVESFRKSWDYSCYHHTHTETRQRKVDYQDSDGNWQSKDEDYDVEVYDGTTHTYTYDQNAGESAALGLENILGGHNSVEAMELDFKEQMRTTSCTHKENEAAILDSWDQDPEKPFTKVDFLRIADMWKDGSTILANLPHVRTGWTGLPGIAGSWKQAKSKSKSISYFTKSKIDFGPDEYQSAQSALSHTSNLHRNLDEILASVDYVNSTAPHLKSMVEQYIQVARGDLPGDCEKMAKEIVDTTRKFYRENFKAGLDVDRFRWYAIALWMLLGGAVGAAGGFALDKIGEANDWYKPSRKGCRWNPWRMDCTCCR